MLSSILGGSVVVLAFLQQVSGVANDGFLFPGAYTVPAAVFINYKCSIGGNDNRVLRFNVNYAGLDTSVTNTQNAENLKVVHTDKPGSASYDVSIRYSHSTCITGSQNRKCAYFMEGGMIARAFEPSHDHQFWVPDEGDMYCPKPVVREACSPPGGKACPDPRKGSPCGLFTFFAGA